MTKIIDLKNLCKTYVVNKRQNNVLKNVNLVVEDGEMVAIMGPSGSGKSTLLYTVSGMDKATCGKIMFNGCDITKLKQDKLADIRLNEMGFILQQMYMMKNLTVLDNIVLPAIRSNKDKRSKKEKIKSAEDLMRKLDIINIADNDINEVSGGQLQRACICRSMINNPKIIFADEPTGSLNRTSSLEVMEELVKLNREGTAIMMVTHDPKIAAKCSRVLYIIDGNIQGELDLKTSSIENDERERKLNNWLMELGW